jgi:hypothetical protein
LLSHISIATSLINLVVRLVVRQELLIYSKNSTAISKYYPIDVGTTLFKMNASKTLVVDNGTGVSSSNNNNNSIS